MGVNKTTIAFPLGFDKYLIIEIGEENIVLMVVEAQGKRVYLQKFPYKNQSIHGLVKGKTYRWSPMWEWTLPIWGPSCRGRCFVTGISRS